MALRVRNVITEPTTAKDRITTRAAAKRVGKVPDPVSSSTRNASARINWRPVGENRTRSHGRTPAPRGGQNVETMKYRGR